MRIELIRWWVAFKGFLRDSCQSGTITDGVTPVTDFERQQLIQQCNQIEQAYPVDRCVHELIEDQARRTPEAVAVVFQNDQITYRQLNERANQLAHHLREMGVKPDSLVGVCLERSLEMVVGLLGVLKAGG